MSGWQHTAVVVGGRRYSVLMRTDESGLWATVAELPGVFAAGDTREELMECLAEAVALYRNDVSGLPSQCEKCGGMMWFRNSDGLLESCWTCLKREKQPLSDDRRRQAQKVETARHYLAVVQAVVEGVGTLPSDDPESELELGLYRALEAVKELIADMEAGTLTAPTEAELWAASSPSEKGEA